jgi:hypothetical protein
MLVCLPCSARGWLWVVFDNLHALGRVDEHFQFRSPDNRLVGVMGEDSQFEVRGGRGGGGTGGCLRARRGDTGQGSPNRREQV